MNKETTSLALDLRLLQNVYSVNYYHTAVHMPKRNTLVLSVTILPELKVILTPEICRCHCVCLISHVALSLKLLPSKPVQLLFNPQFFFCCLHAQGSCAVGQKPRQDAAVSDLRATLLLWVKCGDSTLYFSHRRDQCVLVF